MALNDRPIIFSNAKATKDRDTNTKDVQDKLLASPYQSTNGRAKKVKINSPATE